MTGVETEPDLAPPPVDDAVGTRPRGRRLLVQLRVPIVCLAACLAGFVLQFGFGLPGTPVWVGVIVVELLGGTLAHMWPRWQSATDEAARDALTADEPEPEPEPAPPPPEPKRPARAVRPAPPPPPPPPAPKKRRKPAPAKAGGETPTPLLRAPAPPPPPPAPSSAPASWQAEIVWREATGRAMFAALGRERDGEPVTIARSAVVAWPPRSPGSLEGLGRVLESLETAMVDAGWTPVTPGEAWYAKRFEWRGAGSPSPLPAAGESPAAPAAAQAPPRRTLVRGWPEDTAELVRCEIAWASGFKSSRFEAVVRRPGEKRGRPIGGSAPIEWMLKGTPDWRDEEQFAAVKSLRARLIADGWQEVAEGDEWYERRFVWRGDDPAPDALGGEEEAG